jgi:hypothetical protein
MSKERASLNLDDDLDLSGFAPKQQKSADRPDPKTLETVAEQSGFISRASKRRRRRQRSPYQSQLNLKCRENIKMLFQELGDRLGVHDHTTFEQALLALIEKQGYSDLAAQFKELTK